MHSNFITPPDYVETVLILNATEEQITALGDYIKSIGVPYNVYFYNDAMDNQEWLSKITNKSDMVLDAKIKNPQEYFDK